MTNNGDLFIIETFCVSQNNAANEYKMTCIRCPCGNHASYHLYFLTFRQNHMQNGHKI